MITLANLKRLVIVGLLFCNACYAATIQEQCEVNGIDYKVAVKFIADFKDALEKGEKNIVADFISYPLRVNTGHNSHRIINSKETFLTQYDMIFDQPTIQLITSDNDIFCNAQGAMIGAGKVWYKTSNNTAKIFVINK